MKSTTKKYILTAITIAAIATPVAVFAIELLPACARGNGRCQLNDIVQTFVNFTKLLLGFVGSAVLLYFVYGGFVWLTSHGSPDRVKKGKEIVVNTVIGLVIVFAAYTIVQFVFQAFGARESAKVGQECTQGDSRGIYVADPSRAEGSICVTSCTADLLGETYDCMNPADGVNCIAGLCPGGSDNVCCQRP